MQSLVPLHHRTSNLPAWAKGNRKAAIVEETVWQWPWPWQAILATSAWGASESFGHDPKNESTIIYDGLNIEVVHYLHEFKIVTLPVVVVGLPHSHLKNSGGARTMDDNNHNDKDNNNNYYYYDDDDDDDDDYQLLLLLLLWFSGSQAVGKTS